MRELTTLAARNDLTDRECAKIIGGCIGGLCQMATVETVRNAVKWWATQTDAWKVFIAWQANPTQANSKKK